MTVTVSLELPLPSNSQCRELSGVDWHFDGRNLKFARMVSAGEPSWRKGAEGIAYPLTARNSHEIVAYLKMFNSSVQLREERTRHLIDYQWADSPFLQAAPVTWVDTRADSRPDGINFDFCGYLSRAVPGRSWAEWKTLICEGEDFPNSQRLRCASELLESLRELESRAAIHGDPSPGNIVIDLLASPGDRMMQLCDFDAHVRFDESGDVLSGLSTTDGGACGTPGYSHPDIQERFNTGEDVLPESDHFGRDILLLELLGFAAGNDSETSPIFWPEADHRRLWKRALARLSRCDRSFARPLRNYLQRHDILQAIDAQRQSSSGLLRTC